MSSRHPGKASSRRLQDIFKTYQQVKLWMLIILQDIFYLSRRIQHIFETFCKDGYLQKELPKPRFWEIYGQGIKFPRVNSLDIPKLFKNNFFKKQFIKWLLLQTISLLNSSTRKDIAVSVNTESMNKSKSKNVFLRF